MGPVGRSVVSEFAGEEVVSLRLLRELGDSGVGRFGVGVLVGPVVHHPGSDVGGQESTGESGTVESHFTGHGQRAATCGDVGGHIHGSPSKRSENDTVGQLVVRGTLDLLTLGNVAVNMEKPVLQFVPQALFLGAAFLDGVDALLRKMPDGVPPGVLTALADKSTVLPVPLTAPPGTGARDAHLLLWNHRWEYDKAPGVFVDAMQRLVSAGVAFRLAVLGARSEPPPAELIRLRQVLGERIVVDAMLPRDDYLRVVAGAAIVVSTAIHEFQGLAVMEATAAGCRPLVPDALCYPEQYPAAYRYPAGDAVALYEHLRGWLDVGLPPPVDMVAWSESTLLPQWSELLTDLLR